MREAIKTLQRALERAVGSAEQGGFKLEIWKTLEHPNMLELYGASCLCYVLVYSRIHSPVNVHQTFFVRI